MKVKMTGTGSILCSSLSASALIDESVQIDVPNGYCKKMRLDGDNLDCLDVVILTHFHGDHYFDFPFLLLEQGMSERRKSPLRVFGPKGIETRLRELHGFAFSNWDKVVKNARVEFYEFTDEWVHVSTRAGKYEVLARHVEHGIDEAYGVLVRRDGKTIGYTGDTRLCETVREIVALSDLVVLDVSFPHDSSAHMGLESATQIVSDPANRDKIFLATHMTDEVRKVQSIDRLILPNDGDVFYVGEQQE